MTEENKKIFIFFSIIAVIYLAYAGIFSYFSPIGLWRNQILGVVFYKDSDPTAQYVTNAIAFQDGASSYFIGHPGTPLQALLYFVVQIYYFTSQLVGFKGSYYQFCASKIYHIFFLAKITMSFIHLISFYVLFRFSLRLLKNLDASLLSVLGYATTLSVLYYLTRASIEPFMVIFFLGSFLAYWTYDEHAAVNASRGKYIWLIAVAFLSISGFFSKLHLLALFPVYMLVLIFFNAMRRGGGKQMLLEVSVFSTFSVFFAALWSLKVDWRTFYEFWIHYTPANYQRDAVINGSSIIQIKIFILSLAGYVSNFFKTYFSYSREGIYAISEFFFYLIALMGMCLYFRKHQSRHIVAPIIYWILMFPLILFKVSFHYLFLYQAIAAVFFGLAVFSFMGRIAPKKPSAFRFISAIVIIIMIHAFAIYAMFDSRIHDVTVYDRNIKPYYDALDVQGYQGKVFVLYQGDKSVGRYHIYGPYSTYYPADMALFREFKNVFKFIKVEQNYDDIFSLIKKRFPNASIIYEPANISQVIEGELVMKVVRDDDIKSPKGPF